MSGLGNRGLGVEGPPIGPNVVPFWGSYFEFYKVIPKKELLWGLGVESRVQAFGCRDEPLDLHVSHVSCRPVCSKHGYPDPREDLESRSPNLGPYTTKGTL